MKILFNILDKIFGIKSVVEKNEIGHVVMDSRKVQKGDLFFAINNGNSYIDDVLEKGAALVMLCCPSVRSGVSVSIRSGLTVRFFISICMST